MFATITLVVPADVTPAEYLASLPKPKFALTHRLPHLTYWSWPFSFELRVEIATNWGYALDLTEANPALVAQMSNSNSTTAKLISLATNNPGKFFPSVTVWRTFDSFTNPPAGLFCTNSDGLFVDSTGTNFFSGNEFVKVFSPEGPDDYWQAISEHQAAQINIINSNVPIAIILNGGEYALDVVGVGKKAWLQDPRVQQQDVMTNTYHGTTNTNGISWPHYASRQKSHQLSFLTTKLNEYVPEREMYVFYSTGNEQSRFVFPGPSGYGVWREESAAWGWWSEYMNTNTDLPSFENYYVAPVSWTNATGTTMFNVTDLLTKHLNAVAYNLTLGKSNNYSWVCAGWSNSSTNALSNIPRYMGFLKCLYVSGMVGGVAGYFAYPDGINGPLFGGPAFDASFPADAPPHWLQQIVALGRVHALFSHLDDFLYDGELLSGPQKHFMSTDLPAYEFTNTVADATCRVLARKLDTSNEWLITAWAAYGESRNVTVEIPDLGEISILAKPSGGVYRGTKDTESNPVISLWNESKSKWQLPGTINATNLNIGVIYQN